MLLAGVKQLTFAGMGGEQQHFWALLGNCHALLVV
jgi:hypothetical protein